MVNSIQQPRDFHVQKDYTEVTQVYPPDHVPMSVLKEYWVLFMESSNHLGQKELGYNLATSSINELDLSSL